MKDSWCRPLYRDGKMLYGGAARNARIADAGGQDTIIHEVGDFFRKKFEAEAAERRAAQARAALGRRLPDSGARPARRQFAG